MNQDSIDSPQVLTGGKKRKKDERKHRQNMTVSQRRPTSPNSSERRTSPRTRKSPSRQRLHRRDDSFSQTSGSLRKNSSQVLRASSPKGGKQYQVKGDSLRRKPPRRSQSEVPNKIRDDAISQSTTGPTSPRRKVKSHRSSCNVLHQSMSTYSPRSPISRSISVDAGNSSLLKFDIDAPRDPLWPNAPTDDAVSITTSSTNRDMTPEQKAWAGIANVLHHGDASVNSASESDVLPHQVLKALRDMRRNGPVVRSLGTDPYAFRITDVDDDDDDDSGGVQGEASKATESLQSSMPSLCEASIASLATTIISAFPPDTKNQITVQSKPRDNQLRMFCSELLGAIQTPVSASSPTSNGGAIENKEEMVSYLHHLLVSAYTKEEGAKPRRPSSTTSMDDSMPSLLDCMSETETSGIDLLRSTNSVREHSIALEGINKSSISRNEELNSSMPSLLSCRTGDLLDAECATKWASYGDLDHIEEDDEASSTSGSTSERNEILPNSKPPIAKSPMRRSTTIDVPRSSPSIAKPVARRAKTESLPTKANKFGIEATPDETFAEFIPRNKAPNKYSMSQSREQRLSLLKLFSRRRDAEQLKSTVVTKPKIPVRTFRQRVSLLKFRGNKQAAKDRKKNSRSEERFFPKEEISEEYGGNLLLP